MEAFSSQGWQQVHRERNHVIPSPPPHLLPSSSFTLNPAFPAGFVRNPTSARSGGGGGSSGSKGFLRFPGFEDDLLVSSVIPAVTVVIEGRSICHRISLHKHDGYPSLARALRKMFVDEDEHAGTVDSEKDLDLSNAVPGHLIAYEDMENDLLLVGDLNWKDFVRVAKRIRILPVKGPNSSSRYRSGSA
ncbi:hypothetical protein MLD38_014029 [Melastoma candidum]|uniref:Uncharacterized protein n=1 Tax=Melastoma candidum TaxID=119954 RepID=A0ACB9RBK3_9MYRT|nr:hypothetical protein MLD38_014029 [Melastoma candidum]